MPSHSIHLTHGTRRSYSETLFTLPLKVHLLSRNNLASTLTRISLYPVLSLISFASVVYRIHQIKSVFNIFPLKVHLLSRNNLASTLTRISLYPVLSLISFASVVYRIHQIKSVFNIFLSYLHFFKKKRYVSISLSY